MLFIKINKINKVLYLKIISIISIILINTGCSTIFGDSDEGIVNLNSRVDNGVVLLGGDTADESNKELKNILVKADDNILSPADDTDEKKYTSIFQIDLDSSGKNSREANYAVTSKLQALNKHLINQLKITYRQDAKIQTNKNNKNKNTKNTEKIAQDNNIKPIYKPTLFKGISFNKQQLRSLMDGYSADFDQYASEDQLSKFAKFVRGAMNNKSEYQSNLADFYLDGINGESYKELALSWYLIAASNNNPYAQYMLSILYERGLAVDQDLSKSVQWYRNATGLKNSSDAKILVSKRFSLPTSAIYNKKLAIQWMQSAAKDENVLAQELLGDMYLQGQGVKQSELDALKWYAKAAAHDSTYAQYSLGLMFYNGQGVEQNLQEASRLLSSAAFGGNKEAQFLLGRMYQEGFGVKKDKATAYALWQLIGAENVAISDLDKKIKHLITNMTPEERIKADKLTKYFKSKVVTI